MTLQEAEVERERNREKMSGKGVNNGILSPVPVPTEWVEVAHVDSLYLYPLKSGKAIQVKEAKARELDIVFLVTILIRVWLLWYFWFRVLSS